MAPASVIIKLVLPALILPGWARRVVKPLDEPVFAQMTEEEATEVLRKHHLNNTASWLTNHTTCGEGISCRKVPANGLTFDCRFAGEGAGLKGDVMMLHGFPEWSKMYEPLMRTLASRGYRSVACDQRGYSVGARPAAEADYNYNLLRDDIFAVADAVGFQRFHLVAHDHGAVLGWYAAGSARGKERFMTYTAMSIPHNDAFSAGLFGPAADKGQQMASQYFSIFVMPNSATMKMNTLYLTMGTTMGFDSAAHFQKSLWWYNGAFSVGVLAMPPSYTAMYLMSQGSVASAAMRMLFGGSPSPGYAQKVKTGTIDVPVLYVCGEEDVAIYCHHEYALRTKDYVSKDYRYVGVPCGHDTLACKDSASTQTVIDAIVARIATVTV